MNVQRAGGDLVQMRLPYTNARLVQNRNRRLLTLAQGVAEAGRQLQTARACADNQHPMK